MSVEHDVGQVKLVHALDIFFRYIRETDGFHVIRIHLVHQLKDFVNLFGILDIHRLIRARRRRFVVFDRYRVDDDVRFSLSHAQNLEPTLALGAHGEKTTVDDDVVTLHFHHRPHARNLTIQAPEHGTERVRVHEVVLG